MKSKKGNAWQKIFYFILGMVVMMLLDMVFQFNNSIEKGVTRELNKVQKKIEETLE
jgi:hypothetical protein